MGERSTGGRRGIAGVLSDLFVREHGPEVVERLPGGSEDEHTSADEEDARPSVVFSDSWPPNVPAPPPSPFDSRIAATEREVEQARAAHQEAVEEMFQARDAGERYIADLRGTPPDRRELARLEAAYGEARGHIADAGDRLKRARVRLSALQQSRTRWWISQW